MQDRRTELRIEEAIAAGAPRSRARARRPRVAGAPAARRAAACSSTSREAWASRTASALSRELGDVLDAVGPDRGGVRSRGVVAGAGPPAPEGPRVPLGGRQAGAVLAGRRRGVPRPAGRGGRRDGSCWTATASGSSLARAEVTKARLEAEVPWPRRRRQWIDEPRTDHRHRADRAGEGDRQGDPLRGAGVCPAVGLAEVARARRQRPHPHRPQDRRVSASTLARRSSRRSPTPSSRSAWPRPRR